MKILSSGIAFKRSDTVPEVYVHDGFHSEFAAGSTHYSTSVLTM